jgi:hypothetical protein
MKDHRGNKTHSKALFLFESAAVHSGALFAHEARASIVMGEAESLQIDSLSRFNIHTFLRRKRHYD